MEAIRSQVVVAAAQDLVWWAWTHADRITKWFAPVANIEPRVGGAFELFFNPSDREHDCTVGCTFTVVEPMSRLGFTWKGPKHLSAIMNKPDHLTSVIVTLEPVDGGTQVTVEHTGWGEGEAWSDAHAWHVMAWDQVLPSLKKALESGQGDLCCAPGEGA